MLAVPCGIPRDISELVQSDPALGERIRYVGMDLDSVVLFAAQSHLAGTTLRSTEWLEGDALRAEAYPPGHFDLVVSTGLGEFLDDAKLAVFYRHIFEALDKDGVFFTSATAFEPRSHFLMKTFELEAQYRSREQMQALLGVLPWQTLELESDSTGLQTFVRAVK